jgi:hypothetical protein
LLVAQEHQSEEKDNGKRNESKESSVVSMALLCPVATSGLHPGANGTSVGVVLGLVLVIVGIVVSLTVVGAIVGIPLAILGLLLIVRGLF